MKLRKMTIWLLAAMLLILSACSNNDASSVDNEKGTGKKASENLNMTGMPIVKEPVTLHFMTGNNSLRAADWNDVKMWQKYEDMTNVHIDWGLVPSDGLEEKRNLALSGGNYPGVFYNTGMPTTLINKYGSHGTFLKLNDLIQKYMPHLKKLLENYPAIKKGITLPDGNIYSLPHIKSPDFESMLSTFKPFIRQDWLNKLDMDMPKTTDDFYNYLKAVKETDLNGNGKHDEIPYADRYSGNGLLYLLKGAYGLGTRGAQHGYIDIDPETDELRFFPIADNYKDMIAYVHKLYSDGLILQNIYSIETNKLSALGQQKLIGSVIDTSVDNTFGMTGDEYVGLPQLTGPEGYHMWTGKASPLTSIGNFVITDNAKHPAVAARWVDYLYSEEGSKLLLMGIKGKTYKENDDGTVDWTDEMKNNPDGKTLIQALKPYITAALGGGAPTIIRKDNFAGGQTVPRSLEAMKKLKPDAIDEVWAPFTYTSEETRRLSALSADIEKYVDEMQAKFITGDEPLSNWDNYVETLKQMGLKDYMDIKKAALKRYKSN